MSSGQIYISRDVVFDENVFPFSALHANAGAQLRAAINLLTSHLLNSPVLLRSSATFTTDVANSSNNLPVHTEPSSPAVVCEFMQDSPGANFEPDSSAVPCLAPGGSPPGSVPVPPALDTSGVGLPAPCESPVRSHPPAATSDSSAGTCAPVGHASAAAPSTSAQPPTGFSTRDSAVPPASVVLPTPATEPWGEEQHQRPQT